ncbi:hypothetical protein [Chlorobium sp. KB01]|uniref:hypothetical protein n=1 Tax=Chlorobium sp. KB01 TaxID=1917528 RepID=UPI00097754A9|nr:hypothetical protein [Chlorobium sp. KB01]
MINVQAIQQCSRGRGISEIEVGNLREGYLKFKFGIEKAADFGLSQFIAEFIDRQTGQLLLIS